MLLEAPPDSSEIWAQDPVFRLILQSFTNPALKDSSGDFLSLTQFIPVAKNDPEAKDALTRWRLRHASSALPIHDLLQLYITEMCKKYKVEQPEWKRVKLGGGIDTRMLPDLIRFDFDALGVRLEEASRAELIDPGAWYVGFGKLWTARSRLYRGRFCKQILNSK